MEFYPNFNYFCRIIVFFNRKYQKYVVDVKDLNFCRCCNILIIIIIIIIRLSGRLTEIKNMLIFRDYTNIKLYENDMFLMLNTLLKMEMIECLACDFTLIV